MDVRLAAQQDRGRWNTAVASSPDSTYAHTWDWLDLCREHLGIRLLALAAEEEDMFIGVFGGFLVRSESSPMKRLLTGGTALWSPHTLTWDYGGPCFLEEFKESCASSLVASMEEESRRRGAWCLRISPFSPRISELHTRHGYEPRERLTSIVDLQPEEGRLWRTLDKSFRHDVSRAERFRLEFETGSSTRPLPEILSCFKSLASQKGFLLPPDAFFLHLFRLSTTLLRPRWHIVRDSSDTLLAAGISIGHKSILTLRWGGATREGKARMANHLRMWRTVCWARENGFLLLDLGGIPSNSHDGVYRFKMGLRGEIRHVDWHVKYLQLGRIVRAKRRVRGLLTKATPIR